MRNFPSSSSPRLRVSCGFLIASLLLVVALGHAAAQSTYGTILGTVHDSSGAVVQGAEVTLTNRGTAATRTVVTDEAGDYSFRNIDVGTYAITLTAQGFQKESLPDICPDCARDAARRCHAEARARTRRP